MGKLNLLYPILHGCDAFTELIFSGTFAPIAPEKSELMTTAYI